MRPSPAPGASPDINELAWNRGMAAYPTSSGPRPSIVAIRWPVVSSLRCVQRTAFGAAEVPDVNSSAHRTSGSQSTSRD